MNRALCQYDPAAGVTPDPNGPDADAALAAAMRMDAGHVHLTPERFTGRRIAGSLLVAAAVAGGLLVFAPKHPTTQTAAYQITRSADGTVRARIQWSRLNDPAALQRALDRAHARTRIFVLRGAGSGACTMIDHVTPYSGAAVRWSPPIDTGLNSALEVHPRLFPQHATFVLVVSLAAAGSTGGSTFAPGYPQLQWTDTYMAKGRVTGLHC